MAGLDMARKVFEHTAAERDQEHIDLYLVSVPRSIPDRTGYLLGEGSENPGEGLYSAFDKLAGMGATAIAIACNTAHADPILSVMLAKAARNHPDVIFVNMIEEAAAMAEAVAKGGKAGLLATIGTHRTRLYAEYFSKHPGMELLEPDDEGQKRVFSAIYDRSFGIKATGEATERAASIIRSEALMLADRGADAIILGCTELPLALSAGSLPVPVIDPAEAAAIALINATYPEKLRK